MVFLQEPTIQKNRYLIHDAASCGESDPPEIERQLAHAERNQIRAAYNRAQYLPERRQMMQAWSDDLDALAEGASVLSIRRKTG